MEGGLPTNMPGTPLENLFPKRQRSTSLHPQPIAKATAQQINASLSFISDLPVFQHEKPYELWLPSEQIPDGLSWTNCQFQEHPDIEIEDVRSSKADFGYETTGFKYLNSPLSQVFMGDSNWRCNDSI